MDKYAWLLSLVLRINVVRLNKERYTRKVVRRFYCDNEDEMCGKALETSLSSVLTDKQKAKQYKSIIRTFGFMVFLMSFFTCFPESIWGIVIACAVDIAFFQACLYMAMQRIILLYGTADDEHADEAKSIGETHRPQVHCQGFPSRLYRDTPPRNQVALNCHCQGESRHALQPDCTRDLRPDCRNRVGDYLHPHVQQTPQAPHSELYPSNPPTVTQIGHKNGIILFFMPN